MKHKTNLKNLIVRTFLVLILSITNACAMTKNNSELSRRFSDDFSREYAEKLLEELYPVGSDVNLMLGDLKEIGFKCYNGKKSNSLYCERSRFLSIQWFITIEVNGPKIDKISLQRHLNLP